MIKRILFIMLLVSGAVFAQYDRPGSTDGQFLKIGVSPRGSAMGESFIAAVEGAEAVYYNAAALAWVQGTDIVFNHTSWFAGINHEFASVAHNFGDIGTIGISAIGLYTDEMIVRTPLQPDGTGETFYAGNYKVGVTYSRYFTDKVTIGISLNYLNFSLGQGFSESAYCGDVAAMYTSDFRGFRFAMQISNFGSSVQFVNESYPLPTTFTFGAAMNALEFESQKLMVTFTADKPSDGSPQMRAGAEWNYNNILFLRGGYKFNHEVAKYSFGGGVKMDVIGASIRADYSYSDFSDLGIAHRFGLGIGI